MRNPHLTLTAYIKGVNEKKEVGVRLNPLKHCGVWLVNHGGVHVGFINLTHGQITSDGWLDNCDEKLFRKGMKTNSTKTFHNTVMFEWVRACVRASVRACVIIAFAVCARICYVCARVSIDV